MIWWNLLLAWASTEAERPWVRALALRHMAPGYIQAVIRHAGIFCHRQIAQTGLDRIPVYNLRLWGIMP